MDGYTLTEKMRQARRRFRLTATEQALFYELVAVCNGEGWQEVFDCSNIELCFVLNINEKTLGKARETLINSGLIYYKSGKSRRKVSSYSFVKRLEKNKTTVTSTVNFTVDKGTNETTNKGTNETTNSTDYLKLKTKTLRKIYKGRLLSKKRKYEKNLNGEFDVLWNLYDKKIGDKGKLIKKWEKLPESERLAILEYIPKYKESQPDKKYRKNLETFLNQKSWNDELIYEKKGGLNVAENKQTITERNTSRIKELQRIMQKCESGSDS